MDWDVVDFVVFAAMLVGTGVVYALVRWRTDSKMYRFAAGFSLAAVFALIWVNGAVGIIGDANNDANMMYFGVIVVGAIGTIIARFRPYGIVRALCAMALAQAAIPFIALIPGISSAVPSLPMDTLILTAFFVALWLFAARLFWRAAKYRGRAQTPLRIK